MVGRKRTGSKKSVKRRSSKKGSRKSSRKLKREMPKAMKEMQELRKLISSEHKELSNGVPMVKLTNKIFKEAKSDLKKAIEIYKKYKQSGDIPKLYKKMEEEAEAKRKAKKATARTKKQ
jgi:hypothetical protein